MRSALYCLINEFFRAVHAALEFFPPLRSFTQKTLRASAGRHGRSILAFLRLVKVDPIGCVLPLLLAWTYVCWACQFSETDVARRIVYACVVTSGAAFCFSWNSARSIVVMWPAVGGAAACICSFPLQESAMHRPLTAFSAAVIGAFVGGDLMRLVRVYARSHQTPSVIGGVGWCDSIMLSGLWACSLA